VCVEQAERVSGIQATGIYTVHGHGCTAANLKFWIAGARRRSTADIHCKHKRRNAVEPVIGHMRSEGRLARNFLKSVKGDAINALLRGAGHDLCKIANFSF
jgi:transposase, IS5 family